jgi:hypothetical protein
LRFRFFEIRGFVANGPPQGPFGRIGEAGVFYLKSSPTGDFRSVVDHYRSGLDTTWVQTPPEDFSCTDSADCIARILLEVHRGYDTDIFAATMNSNISRSRSLVGYFRTLELLDGLVRQGQWERVTLSACREFSLWYPLEMPEMCVPALSNAPEPYLSRSAYLSRLAAARNQLTKEGLSWVDKEVQPRSQAEAGKYLQFLTRSADDEIRRIGARLSKAP